ncbi:hypothetical protein O5274_26945, partial [Escherichia coli]|nr:hypothetical protein [Escherichia coli]
PTTIKPVNAEVAALQQQTADLFYKTACDRETG